MTETQQAFNFAVKLSAEATLKHAQQMDDSTRDNMIFWQNQLWYMAKELAAEKAN